jgi:hypothetical protein
MQMVGRTVCRQDVLATVEREFPIRNAIRHATERRANEKRCGDVVVQSLVTKHDVRQRPGAIGDPELRERGAVLGNLCPHAVRIAERVDLHGNAVRRAPELVQFDRYCRLRRCGRCRTATNRRRETRDAERQPHADVSAAHYGLRARRRSVLTRSAR